MAPVEMKSILMNGKKSSGWDITKRGKGGPCIMKFFQALSPADPPHP
jgi:hypothetical protein